jgi:antitoxin (DNA-binding transcriptional repressor) of toxin-antitoxin stability system
MDIRTTEFAASEAKARFSELLDRAEAGEEITIRRHGKVVAKLSRPLSDDEAAIEARRKSRLEFVEWRRLHGPSLGPNLTIKQLIEEGRH